MIDIVDSSKCTGCGLCSDVCSFSAIRMVDDANGYLRPEVNKELCRECGACVSKCIALHDDELKRHELSDEHPYAAWSRTDELVRYSASGGVFAQLATDILSSHPQARVYGAALAESGEVSHIAISEIGEIRKLQNSKYKQSNASGAYSAVKADLRQGRVVLFSGTPCQVAALYAFVGYHANLYTAEVICHGVPSSYLSDVAVRLEHAKRIVAYRTKSKGWAKGNRTVYELADGQISEKQKYVRDFHFRAYLSFSTNRLSCTNCPFARPQRVADITMGDFWGHDRYKYQHDEGLSVVLVNSRKGEQLMSSESFFRKTVTWDEITRHNSNIYMPTRHAAYNLQTRIHDLRNRPLWQQKLVLQNGFTNRYLDYIWQKIYALLTMRKRHRLSREAERQRQALLQLTDNRRPIASILTTYFATNFGAMLQPYALKRVLENEGCQVDFIRYKQKAVYDSHLPLSLHKLKGRSLKDKLSICLAAPLSYLQYIRLQQFKRRFLQTDDNFCKQIPADRDYYFFGSDQIWNPKNTCGFDPVYFGQFSVKQGARKVAYAASGENITFDDAACAWLKEHLSAFDAIAVRESSLRENLTRRVGIKDVQVVLDPTLLATKDILDELPAVNPIQGKRFAVFYQVRSSMAYLPKIYAFARQQGLELLILSNMPKKELLAFALRNKGVRYEYAAGMETFLGAMRYADCVFTPSFHGCAFAIINHKRLFALQLGDGLDTRPHDLLCSLGMQSRLVFNPQAPFDLPDTDYREVETRLAELRRHSMEYIRRQLGNTDQIT